MFSIVRFLITPVETGRSTLPPPQDKRSVAAGDSLTVHVSDQVCEAEKDEDGHALNLKGENYTLRSTPGAPLRALAPAPVVWA